MQQDVVLAMLAKEPSRGYELRARLARALGPVAAGINEAQMYVTLSRHEKGGFVQRLEAPAQRSDRKVYCLTPTGQERVTEWMSDVSWPRPDLAEFHMKLIAAAQGALADPIAIIDSQRRDLLRHLRELGRAVMEKDPATAEAFANAHNNGSAKGPVLFSWKQIRDADSKIVVNAQLVLLTGRRERHCGERG